MKKFTYGIITFLYCLCYVGALAVTPLHAAPADADFDNEETYLESLGENLNALPAIPYKVVLNQQNARVFAKSQGNLMVNGKEKRFFIILPQNASHVHFSLPQVHGKSQGTILGWSAVTTEPFAIQGAVQKQQQALETMVDATAAAMETSIVKFEALKAKYMELSKQNKQQEMSITIGELVIASAEISENKRAWEKAKTLAAQGQNSQSKAVSSQVFTITLDTPLAEKSSIHVEYAYTLQGSKWTPSYVINAQSEKDTIHLQLQAEIIQNSHMDWSNTQVEFSTVTGNAPSPAPVQPWIAGESAAAYGLVRSKAAPMRMDSAQMANSAVTFNENTPLASWALQKKLSIPEGKSTLILLEKSVKLPLQRIARPNTGSRDIDTVWLSANYNLEDDFWPQGKARYLLDNVPVSDGYFQPKAQKVALFFGPDPLVTIQAQKEVRKSSEEGIIQKEQIFAWNWTYTLYNQRKKNVTVRVEEPQVQLAHKDISVLYKDAPKAQQGPDKTLIWNVTVPAQGKEKIQRSITIKAPEKLDIFPGR